jgi:hypothetical protein
MEVNDKEVKDNNLKDEEFVAITIKQPRQRQDHHHQTGTMTMTTMTIKQPRQRREEVRQTNDNVQ